MTPLRFTGARPRLGQGLETVALSGAELEVRIHSPPADSPPLSGFRVRSRAKPGNIAPRTGSVSVGRYSSTAVLPDAVCEIGGIGRE